MRRPPRAGHVGSLDHIPQFLQVDARAMHAAGKIDAARMAHGRHRAMRATLETRAESMTPPATHDLRANAAPLNRWHQRAGIQRQRVDFLHQRSPGSMLTLSQPPSRRRGHRSRYGKPVLELPQRLLHDVEFTNLTECAASFPNDPARVFHGSIVAEQPENLSQTTGQDTGIVHRHGIAITYGFQVTLELGVVFLDK
jgi:hypothetical protein